MAKARSVDSVADKGVMCVCVSTWVLCVLMWVYVVCIELVSLLLVGVQEVFS